MPVFRLGVDIGGTHTDIVLLDTATGSFDIAKVSSTPHDPAIGVLNGVTELIARGLVPGDLEFFAHGTTVTTNALLERKGVRVGLLVNAGFRGIQEVQSQHRAGSAFDHSFQRPPGIAPQRHTREIAGRIDAGGNEITPLDEDAVRRAAKELAALGIRSFAVCYLFSFANPAHEQRTAAIIKEVVPDAFVSPSSIVLARIREWPRLSTTLVNAYLEPVLATYVENLANGLDRAGVSTAQRFLMQSNGGVMPFSAVGAGGSTVRTLLSGPAAGVQGTAHVLGRGQGWQDLISFDMGGTSCDIAFVENAAPLETAESSVGHYSVDMPSLEIASISAGGGTIARLDDGQLLQIGPDSAGAVPGPACYDRGGTRPTVTDMDLLCGFLDPELFLGGSQRLNVEAARRAVGTIAAPLGLTELATAHGVIRLINARMADEIRVLAAKRAVELGRFTLVPFGGAGPLHAAAVAAELEIPRVLVPPNPGAFSALGLLCTDVVHDYIRSDLKLVADVRLAHAEAMFAALRRRAEDELRREGLHGRPCAWERSLDMRYAGQGYEIPVAIRAGNPALSEAAVLADAVRAFHEAHRALHGHAALDQPVEIVSYRLRVRVFVPKFESQPVAPAARAAAAPIKHRELFFDPTSPVRAPVYQRADLAPDAAIAGPALVVQLDATTVIPPQWHGRVDAFGNLVLERR